jgi:amidase
VPEEDAVSVARLKAAGGILLGKTNMPLFGLSYETENTLYGRTNNPYDLARTPGGSSGGEAAVIAAGGSPVGVGADGGGSIRYPAHCCGIAGLKPTSGRVPRTGHFPPPGGMLDRLWQPGPLARRVEDLALLLPIIAGEDGRDPSVVPMPLRDATVVDVPALRVAWHGDNGAGARVEERRPPGIEQTLELFFPLWTGDGGTRLRALLEATGTARVPPMIERQLAGAFGGALDGPAIYDLLARLDRFRAAMLTFMEGHDVILCPVHAQPAPPHGSFTNPATHAAYSYTMTWNLTGWPAATVRGGTSPEGLPVGVQIVARPWREDHVLAVAACLETATGGWQAPPL